MIEYFSKVNGEYITGEEDSYTNFKSNEHKEFLCLLIQNPTDNEIAKICKDYALEEKPFKKFKTETRSLRYNFNPLTFTFTDYYTKHNKVKLSHILYIIKNNLLILVISDTSTYYSELFKKVLETAKRNHNHSTAFILYQFLHQDAKENYEVLENFEDQIVALEKETLSASPEKQVIHDIIALKKELIKMSKRLWASSKIIFTIKKELTSIKLTKEEMSLLDDIYDTFLHQIDMIETQKETVTDLLSIFTTTISNRLAATSNELNFVMKKMAALTIIIMVPTMIAGVYGTNFHNLPEITWQYGYFYMLGFMALSAGITYYLFHKKNWI